MKKDLKLVAVLLLTFIIAIATSLLLEIPIMQHWLRQSLIVVLILVQLYFGFVVVKSIID